MVKRTTLGALVALPPVAVAAALFLPGLSTHPDDSAERYQRMHRVKVEDYATVSLPVTPPPPDALVEVSSFVDPLAHGQGVSFQYSGFTIRACTVDPAVAVPDACQPQEPVRVLRTVKDGRYRTVFSTYSKYSSASTDQSRGIEQFFATADVVRAPAWLTRYAADTVKELFE